MRIDPRFTAGDAVLSGNLKSGDHVRVVMVAEVRRVLDDDRAGKTQRTITLQPVAFAA